MIASTALGGSSSLDGWIRQGLGELIGILMSFTAAEPYFAPITVHADEAAPAAPAEKPLRQGIILDHVNFSYGDKPAP